MPLPQLDRHVGELRLGELEAGDRPARTARGRGVRERRLEAVAGRADRAEDDAEARLGRGSRAGRAGPCASGSTASAGSRTSSRTSSLVTEARSDSLWWISGAREARRVGRDDEAADAVVGPRPDDRDVGDRAVGDPHLACRRAPSRRRRARRGCACRPGSSRSRARSGRSSRWPRRRPSRAATGCFCSSEPKRWMANIASDPCTETRQRTPESAASSSMQARPYDVALVPAHP